MASQYFLGRLIGGFLRKLVVYTLFLSLILIVGLVGLVVIWQKGIFSIALERSFEQALGCDIAFDNPQIAWRSKTASISDVSIHCPADAEDERVQADTLAITLDEIDRDEMVVRLGKLTATSLHVVSGSRDSSFYRVLDLILRRTPNPKPHWRATLRELSLEPASAETTNLTLREPDTVLTFSGVHLLGEALDTPGHEKSFLDANATTFSLAVKGREFDLGMPRVRVSFVNSQMIVEEAYLTGSSADEILSISGVLRTAIPREYQLAARGHLPTQARQSLWKIFPKLQQIGFEPKTIDVSLTGPLQEPLLNGSFAGALLGQPLQVQELEARLDAVSGKLESGGISTQFHATPAEIIFPNVRAQKLAMSEIFSALQQLDVPINSDFRKQFQDGTASASGEVSVDPKDYSTTTKAQFDVDSEAAHVAGKVQLTGLQGTVDVDQFRFGEGERSINTRRPFRLHLGAEAVRLDPVEILAAGQTLRVEGGLGWESGWDIHVSGKSDVESLLPSFAEFEQLTGTLEGDVRVLGPVGAPIISGPVRLHDGVISTRVGDTFVGVNNLEIEAQLTPAALTITSLRGSIGDGQVVGQGAVTNPFDSSLRSGDIHLILSRVSLQPFPRASAEIEGKIRFQTFPEQLQPSLSGELKITNALYRNTIDLRRMIAMLGDVFQGGYTAPNPRGGSESTISLDLNVRAENSVIVETNVAQAELSGIVHVGGNASTPLLDGTVQFLSGTFVLQATTFDVISGVVTFPRGNRNGDPNLNIVSEATINAASNRQQHLVHLVIQGTLNKPIIHLSSDSGLDERQIVALLSQGRRAEGVLATEGGRRDRDFQLGRLINPQSDLTLDQRLSRITGFTDITVEPSNSLETGEVVPLFSARRPISNNLSATVTRELGEAQKTTAGFLYEITPHVSAVTGWKSQPVTDPESRRGSFGGGLRFRKTFPGSGIVPPLDSLKDPKER